MRSTKYFVHVMYNFFRIICASKQHYLTYYNKCPVCMCVGVCVYCSQMSVMFDVLFVSRGDLFVSNNAISVCPVVVLFVRDVSVSTIFKGVTPFWCADIIRLILLTSIPALSLFLPSLM